MPQSWLNAIQRWTKRGMYWPFVHDPERGAPSVTLMFFYITFVLAVSIVGTSSVLQLIKGEYIMATIMPSMLLLFGFVFYRMRNLDKVKFDLDNKSVEFSDEKDENDDNEA